MAYGKYGMQLRIRPSAMQRAYNRTVSAGKRMVGKYMPSTPTPSRKRKAPASTIRSIKRQRIGTPMNTIRRRLLTTKRRIPYSTRYGATSSKSSGFIKTRSRVSYRGRSKATNLGVVDVIETGGVLDAGANSATAGNTVAVGHCNFPSETAHLIFWRAIVKKLAVRAGMPVYNFQQVIQMQPNDLIVVVYRTEAKLNESTSTYTANGSTDTLEGVAQLFYASFQAIDDGDDMEFREIRYVPSASQSYSHFSGCKVDLQNASFVLFSKSTLKVQNRTVNSVGGDEESVDNVPLYGKAYFGKGSGVSPITNDQNYTTAAPGFWCDSTSGVLAKVPLEKWYQEVPQASHFRGVFRTGKVHMDPGHLQTSVLDGKVTISLNKIYKLLFHTEDVANTHIKTYLGRFRFMIVEKMLNSVAGSAANSIKLAYECNLRIGGYIKTRRSTETAQLNNVANLANEQ